MRTLYQERRQRRRALQRKKKKVGLSLAQPKPIKNVRPAVWDLVMVDMQERDKSGARKYGVRLQPFNGRSALVDAYQEALDLAVYLRQRIYEEKGY